MFLVTWHKNLLNIIVMLMISWFVCYGSACSWFFLLVSFSTNQTPKKAMRVAWYFCIGMGYTHLRQGISDLVGLVTYWVYSHFQSGFGWLGWVRVNDCPAWLEPPAGATNRRKATVKIWRNPPNRRGLEFLGLGFT